MIEAHTKRKRTSEKYREYGLRALALNPEKFKARRKTRDAIKYGKLTRQPCEVCGAVPAEAHHDDYSKPLDVRFLCKKHHTEVHRGDHTARGARRGPPRHKTHCKHGHPMVGDNIYETNDGRRCRECYRIRDARRSRKSS